MLIKRDDFIFLCKKFVKFFFLCKKFVKFFVFFFFLDVACFLFVSDFVVYFYFVKLVKFLFVGRSFIAHKSALRSFFFTMRDVFYGFYYLFVNEFFLDGIYYRVKYYKAYHSIGFLIGYSSYIVYKLPKEINVRVHMKRRKFVLFGMDKMLINTVSNFLVNFKYPNIYIGKGIKLRRYVYRVKEIVKKR